MVGSRWCRKEESAFTNLTALSTQSETNGSAPICPRDRSTSSTMVLKRKAVSRRSARSSLLDDCNCVFCKMEVGVPARLTSVQGKHQRTTYGIDTKFVVGERRKGLGGQLV